MKRSLLSVSILALFAATASAQQQDPEAALRLLADGERLIQAGDLAAALRNYELLVQQFPLASIADDALLRTAQGRWILGDRQAAEAAIGRLQNEYARTAGAAGAFVLQGNIRMATASGAADLEAAREAFRNVVLLYGRTDFPRLGARASALVRAGEASVLLGESQEAAALFVQAIEDEPESTWTAAARLHLATVLLRAGDWAAAAEILQRIIDSGAAAAGRGADEATVAASRRRLELGYRLLLRPSLSQEPWTGAHQLRFSGPPLKDPIGIAVAEDNRIVIVDTGVPLIAIVEPDGTLSARTRSSDAFRPWWGLGAAPFVATKRSVLNPMSRARQEFFVPENNELKPVEEIVAGTHGVYRQWMVLDNKRKQVLLFDDEANFMTRLMGGDGSEPVDVAVDYLGRLYVLDRKAKEVVRFNAAGGERTRIIQRDWRRPEAIAVDGLGNIYVLDRDAKLIEVFDPSGQLRWQLGPRLPGGIELRSPRDLAVDGSGRVYVADKDLKAFLVVE